MKDRIAQNPNRIGLTDENGVKKIYTLSREDNPTQEGTKLNKANLLSDDTSSIVGLNDSATVNDALSYSLGRVGDIRFSKRTDLPNNWLLCNGSTYDGADYPTYKELFGETSPYQTIEQETILGYQTYYAYSWKCVYLNDYIIICGGYGEEACIWYKKPEDTSWTKKTIFTATSYAFLNGIIYEDGKYVAYGHYANTNLEMTGVWYCNTLDGDWTFTKINQQTTYCNKGVTSVLYVDGYWYVFANYISSNWVCCKSNDITSTTWQQTYITNGSTGITYMGDFDYIGGKFIGCWYGLSSSNSYEYGFVSITNATDLNSWNFKTTLSSSSYYPDCHPSFIYDSSKDVYWLSLSIRVTSDSYTFYAWVYKITSDLEHATRYTLYGGTNLSNTDQIYCGHIRVLNGKVFVPIKEQNASAYSMWISDGINEFERVLVGTPKWRTAKFNDICYAKGRYYASATNAQYSNATTTYSVEMYNSPVGVKMPTITEDGAYAYIRAK